MSGEFYDEHSDWNISRQCSEKDNMRGQGDNLLPTDN